MDSKSTGRISRITDTGVSFDSSSITRRDLLKTGGALLAGMALPFGASCDFLSDHALVSVARDANIETMVRRAVELAGGLGEIKQGQSVLIKPNLVIALPPGYLETRVTTNPEVVRAVIKIIKEKTTADKITVGDKCYFDFNTIEMAYCSGILQVCMEEGVNFLPFESTVQTLPDGTVTGFRQFYDSRFTHFHYPLYLYEAIYNFDHIINVPMMKNHAPINAVMARGMGWPVPIEVPDDVIVMYAMITLCMKNWVGSLPFLPPSPTMVGGDRMTSDLHSADVGQKIAELNLAIPKITMNIIDATNAVLKAGPAGPGAVWTETNMILASKDRVACDCVGGAVMQYYATKLGIDPVAEPYITTPIASIPQIQRATELGIGVSDPSRIVISASGVSEIKDIKKGWSNKGLLYTMASTLGIDLNGAGQPHNPIAYYKLDPHPLHGQPRKPGLYPCGHRHA